MTAEFSVYQYFVDGSCERLAHYVEIEEALRLLKHYTTSVGARIGTTRRVIMTDGGDCLAFEWLYGQGVVYPPGLQLRPDLN